MDDRIHCRACNGTGRAPLAIARIVAELRVRIRGSLLGYSTPRPNERECSTSRTS